MDLSPYVFYPFAILAIACSLLVVLKKNPVASAFSLVMVFFCFAGIYAMLEAHLIAAIQIFVYAGAIMVLFIFVIMLLKADAPSYDFHQSSRLYRVIGIGLCFSIFGLFSWAFQESSSYLLDLGKSGIYTPQAIERSGGNTQVLSEMLFSEYILPFELTSILLLAAIVAAVAIAKRNLSGVSK